MSHPHSPAARFSASLWRSHPMAWAVAVALGSVVAPASQAQQAFSPGWFADRGAAQGAAAQSGRMPNGAPIQFQLPAQQQDAARQKLQQSIDNLGTAAQAIALQQRMQEQARQARREAGFVVADGLGKDGLKVDENPLTRGWINAREATQSLGADGRVLVNIEQTADQAILNWETFNIGGNTTLNFLQNPDWAVLNRVNDPAARPSQILGQLKANGTVFVANRNGVVFGNNSQVNVRNLVAAAARISDAQFRDNGLYSVDANTSALTDAVGKIMVERGARITTHEPTSATRGGGYVLLAGHSVENAGQIETRRGQTQLAAGDGFVIRRGVGTAQNTASTTRGNEIAPRSVTDSTAGSVRNSGLIQAREGDVTLAGRTVEQAGVAVATTTLNQRGTVHLLSSSSDSKGSVTLATGSTTAVLIEDDGKSTALDSQRDALIRESAEQDKLRGASNSGTFDNLSRLQDRREQSRIEVVSGGDVNFQAGSLAVATGGQVIADASRRSYLDDGARVDVSGAVGVQVAMESNNVKVKVQGNELRDSPDNRDSGKLISSEVWIDRRQLIEVAAGTGGYEGTRWYAGGGLLEVGGYLDNQGHSISEWAAQGGTVQLAGREVVSHAGSRINLAGGSLDVQSGVVQQSWLRGRDGQLYRLDDAPAEMLYDGLYQGYELKQERWGVTESFRNPLVAPGQRFDNGYTVGRDAGRLLISAPTAVLQGQVDTVAFQGVQQTRRPDQGQDGYAQAQTAAARNAQLWLGRFDNTGRSAVFDSQVRIGELQADTRPWTLQAPVGEAQRNTVWLDSEVLSAQRWGQVDLASASRIDLDGTLRLQEGGRLGLAASRVSLGGTVQIAGGQVEAGNLLLVLGRPTALLSSGRGALDVAAGARIDLGGGWSNALAAPEGGPAQAWIDGGQLRFNGSHDINVGEGARISVDAGGVIDANGKGRVGKGGSVSLLAASTEVATDGSGRIRIGDGARFSALGNGSGNFSLATGGAVAIGAPGTDASAASLRLQSALFRSGFAGYDIAGHNGLTVEEGTQLQVERPALRLAEGAQQALAREQGVQAWTPSLYEADPASGRVSQRGGASLTLRAGHLLSTADLRVGKGARIEVDPGQSIELFSAGNLDVAGSLKAAGGRIRLDEAFDPTGVRGDQRRERRWTIAEGALLDVSGDSVSLPDARGTLRGQVRKGGTIEIGGALDWEDQDNVRHLPPDTFVVVERGARLDASGASALLDIDGSGRTRVDSDGGSIVLRAGNALYLHGELYAAAGGDGARGGTLGVAFGGGTYGRTADGKDVLAPRVISLTQHAAQTASLPARLEYGHAALSVEQVEAGGFDHLALFGDIRAQGDVNLRMDQSLRLQGVNERYLGFVPGNSAGSRLQLAAPYVRLAQGRWWQPAGEGTLRPLEAPFDTGRQHRLEVDADLIDLRDVTWLAGFDQVGLRSSGDIRMLAPVASTSRISTLASPGSIDISAARLFPAARAQGRIVAGVPDIGPSGVPSWQNPDAVLRIHGIAGGAQPAPDSAFGSLELVAATVVQGGTVQAPWGRVQLGGNEFNSNRASRVDLLAGSVTSISGAGLALPFGGTVDGVSWRRNGADFDVLGPGSTNIPIGIDIVANAFSGAAGSVLDVSGGGELSGAAFVAGRGGSVDILRHALADANPRYRFSGSDNAVYAIMPGRSGTQAPLGTADGSADPRVGQQIIITAGVPGLPAGTYTLLPASYALQKGAFRVEVGAESAVGSRQPVATGTGSWRVSGHQAQSLGGGVSPLLTDLVLTPAEVVRRHASYNETSYSAFVQGVAERRGEALRWRPTDAGNLNLVFGDGAGRSAVPAAIFQGLSHFNAGSNDGRGGTLSVNLRTSDGAVLEIATEGGSAGSGSGATIFDSALNAFRPETMLIGGVLRRDATTYSLEGSARHIVVRNGVTLTAQEVLLSAAFGGKGILVEQGASIDTLTGADPSRVAQSTAPYLVSGGLLAVSNQRLTALSAQGGGAAGPVAIDIGGCVVDCSGQTRLLSAGSINVVTDGALNIGDAVSYGTRQLGLGMSALNLGSAEAIAAASAAGGLPVGMTMNQEVLQRLLRGNTATGAPALEALNLTARDAINVFGSVDLDTREGATGRSSLRSLVLGAPAIHGYGTATDRARIFADTLVWDGTLAGTTLPGGEQTQPAGEAMVGRLGQGQLEINTRVLELGRAPLTRPSSSVAADRQVLGFAGVTLAASDRMLFSGKGSLEVFQRRGEYVAGSGWQFSGGALDIVTPLLTGNAGAQLAIRNGGTVQLRGAAATAGSDALGAELSITTERVVIDSRVALASGRFEANARQGVALGSNAVLDMAGRKVSLFDVDKYSWGGDVALSSRDGDIVADAASRIDLSAGNNRGGRLTVAALGAQGGRVDLAGTLLGGASGRYDAGGTEVPYDGGELVVRARQLQDFSGLNTRLTAGGITGGRTFQLSVGDLVIGDEVKARNVDISVDGGSLLVNGRIDASGEQVGSIRLSARDVLRIDGTLDAHGSALRVDSYGKIIDSPNRAMIELTSANGGLQLGAASSMDLRSGTSVATGGGPGQNDGRARGSVKLDVPRVGTNDAAIHVASGIRIAGAGDLQVNAFRSYDSAPLASAPDVHGHRPQVINQQWLDTVVDPDNSQWMNAALVNTGLQQRTAALGSYRLRPGVQIVARTSSDNPRGDLVVAGDIDLSGYRYGPQSSRLDPARRGFGESAALVLRAEGDINVYGSINDGFAPPPANPDEDGWVLLEGRSSGTPNTAFGGDLIVPGEGVQLQRGTEFRAGATLNYALPFEAVTLPAGTVLPAEMVLSGPLLLPAGTVLGAAVTTGSGQVMAAGTVLAQALALQSGARLGAGFRLRTPAPVAAQVWPAGVALPMAMKLSGALDLHAGAIIPSMTKVELAGDAPVKLRTADASGRQGRNWALAAMLPDGTTSWDLTAVAGADTAAADPRTRRWGSDGSIVLADSHYSTIGTVTTTTEWKGDRIVNLEGSLYWWGDESLAGKSPAEVAEIIGTTEAEICGAGSFCGPAPRLVDKEGSLAWWGDESWVGRPASELGAEMGMSEEEICAAMGYCYGGGTLTEVTTYGKRLGAPAWSVLRTGKGDLALLAAQDVRMKSGFGVYTAGAPTLLGDGNDARFNAARAPKPMNTALLGATQASGSYDAAIAGYQAWYPDQGGNLRVEAGRDIIGDVWTGRSESGTAQRDQAGHSSAAVGGWLWRQGSGTTEGVQTTATSWWINFGTYSTVGAELDATPRMVGFTGFGTLGGGNLSLEAGRHSGVISPMGNALGLLTAPHSSAIVAAVGSTGRVSDGELHLTGGGDLTLRSGGALNPGLRASAQQPEGFLQDLDLNGAVTNLRGSTLLQAAHIGGVSAIQSSYGTLGLKNPFVADAPVAMAGPVLILGDSTALVQARGDVVLGSAADPGRVPVANFNDILLDDGSHASGSSWFSLWTQRTALDLFSAGGNLSPGLVGTQHVSGSNQGREVIDISPSDGDVILNYWLYPSRFSAVAASGNINLASLRASGATLGAQDVILLAPSASGRLEVLAGGSILAAEQATQIVRSSSDARVPGPFDPGFIARGPGNAGTVRSNVSVDGGRADPEAVLPYFAFGPNTALGALLPTTPAVASRFYAVAGDIIGLGSGSRRQLSRDTGNNGRTVFDWYEAGSAVQLRAGRDVINANVTALNTSSTDISGIDAGRDIIRSNLTVAGPGNVEVSAGRQLRQEEAGSIVSLGGIVQGDTRPGASIAVTAGNQHLDFDALRARYLDPAALADPAQSLASQPGKAVKIYDKELKQWLQQRFGTSSEGLDALAVFDALPKEQQRIFLRQVYYAELREGGREYTNAEGPRFGSYLRGREAIATLMPDKDANGATINRTGDIVMYGGSGVRTEAGGNIELMAPGGQIVVGVQGVVPPASAGLVTQGHGDIRLFSQDSVLLGLSRVMTTFGGDILAWSEQGDINAGRGSQTTLLYTPPRRVYDTWGNVILAPQAPASGAGIATLNPIAEVAPGDVDLIAPLGTIDAGEAGIRVSGNINLAALQVLNAANIQVQGDSKGLPVLASVNVNALASASAAANSASQAAQDVMRKSQDDARRNQPSVISVQILGFGSASSSIDPPTRGNTAAATGYDVNSAFQFPQARADAGKQQVQ
ncbi:filamentous haemagglutinin family protein [Stenotrophomonas indicatrix]|uniref:Filamentous hemagglutinin family protein n=1 Tax=Stenotrophomonas indicatrix TaxID=2045451 RepID=A0ABT8QC36_9GAMM|nr:filamentous haemagglutinin family protein [Stenotrophomonas indicatrix]MDN8663491.1 filamentous hemagglutinin family protein [Stenotrophomonas indicatrix]MDN8669470.1 filamentous hemagglutinin family protein [Stenotrophomonas indicatrix]